MLVNGSRGVVVGWAPVEEVRKQLNEGMKNVRGNPQTPRRFDRWTRCRPAASSPHLPCLFLRGAALPFSFSSAPVTVSLPHPRVRPVSARVRPRAGPRGQLRRPRRAPPHPPLRRLPGAAAVGPAAARRRHARRRGDPEGPLRRRRLPQQQAPRCALHQRPQGPGAPPTPAPRRLRVPVSPPPLREVLSRTLLRCRHSPAQQITPMDFSASIYDQGECHRKQIPLKHAWALTARAAPPSLRRCRRRPASSAHQVPDLAPGPARIAPLPPPLRRSTSARE